MDKVKIGFGIVAGIILAVNATGYLTASGSVLYDAQYQQIVQIKHLLWIFMAVYIAVQVRND